MLVVDKSDSMNDVAWFNKESKWEVTARAVKDILGTFTIVDFMNIIVFSDEAEPLWTLSDLIRVRAEHLENLRTRVDKVKPGGNTNFTAAFEAAFRILTNADDEEESRSHCHKVILFLTDGVDTTGPDGKSIKPSEMAAAVNAMQHRLEERTGSRASIFTYSMTRDADDAIPRQLACANNGAWSFIRPNTNTFDALNSYYLYFASRRIEMPIWVEPYDDASGLGLLTTVAIPFFAEGTEESPDVFLGVAGHDVGLHEFEIGGVTSDQALHDIIRRSRQCISAEITPCEQQIYREAQDPLSECPDTVLAEDIRANSCFTFRDSAYKVFVEEVNWEEAKELCVEDGGQLVSIVDEDELAFLARLAQTDGSWVGAHRQTGGRFSWIDSEDSVLEDGSEYWGVREPIFMQGREPCVAIDSRGVMKNLFVKPCTEEASFICKYDSAESCGGVVRAPPRRGYFTVPPADLCHMKEVLDAARPIDDAAKILTRNVVCPLGNISSKSNTMCCALSSHSDHFMERIWFWVTFSVALFVLSFLICFVFHRLACRIMFRSVFWLMPTNRRSITGN